ncbi:MAG: adenylyltransferase/cytidyltransferase family protein [Flavobacteriales bacterium]
MHYELLSDLLHKLKMRKQSGEKIVFTNGVFDILHLGHVSYLEEARKLGDFLVVGINNDVSVRQLNKGPERPIHDENARAGVIAALRCVDATIIFSDDTPAALIEAIQPHVLVKGGDYDANESDPSSKRYIVGSIETQQRGGRVVCIPLVAGYSTTAAIKKIQTKKD